MITKNSYEAEKQEASVENTCRGRSFVPAVDIIETPHEVRLAADVPGAAADQIDVRFEDGELKIHVPVAPRLKAEQPLLLEEYAVGDYYRAFRLSQEIDSTKIAANYRDGVLTLTLPKIEAAKPRRIAVNAG